MSGFPLQALQTALYEAIRGNAAVMAMLAGVYDLVPAQAAFPYLVLNEAEAGPWDILHESAHICEFRCDLYSRKGGQKEVMQLVMLLRAALHGKPLAANGWDVAQVQVTQVGTDRQADGLTGKASFAIRVWAKEVL